MGLFDRLRRRDAPDEEDGADGRPTPSPNAHPVTGSVRAVVPDAAEETLLRARLEADPNDEAAFRRLAEVVQRRSPEGQAGDTVWALAEEVARSGRAWLALVEMARLSVGEDREGALRRLGTAAERDPSGRALGEGLAVLRGAGLAADALNLGVGHWRPKEHDPEVGRQLVQAAVEAGRTAEARRYLDAFAQFPDQGRAAAVRADLEQVVADASRR